MNFPEHPFWDFALKVYRSPGVSEACLEVQERLGVDVNVLLFCCWVGESGRGNLTPEALARACEAVALWHETVVQNLRAVRRGLKEMDSAPKDLADGLRREIQAREIDAEHIEQLMLAASVADASVADGRPAAARAEDAAETVARYVARLDRSPTGQDAMALAVILAAAFPSIEAGRLRATLARRIGVAF